MMLRTAKPADTGRIVDLLEATHARQPLRRAPVRPPRSTQPRHAGGPAQHGRARRRLPRRGRRVIDGQVEAVIIGTLSRVYMVVDALKAKDLFLVASRKASLLAARKLLGAYIAWAERNPAVYEIELTHTDVTPELGGNGRHLRRWASSPSATPIAGPTRRSRQSEGAGGMSGLFKSIGKIFKKVVPVLKKIALPALAIAAVVVTGGAALGLLPGIAGLGGLAASLGASPFIAGC
jgi:hypothetical protein